MPNEVFSLKQKKNIAVFFKNTYRPDHLLSLLIYKMNIIEKIKKVSKMFLVGSFETKNRLITN